MRRGAVFAGSGRQQRHADGSSRLLLPRTLRPFAPSYTNRDRVLPGHAAKSSRKNSQYLCNWMSLVKYTEVVHRKWRGTKEQLICQPVLLSISCATSCAQPRYSFILTCHVRMCYYCVDIKFCFSRMKHGARATPDGCARAREGGRTYGARARRAANYLRFTWN